MTFAGAHSFPPASGSPSPSNPNAHRLLFLSNGGHVHDDKYEAAKDGLYTKIGAAKVMQISPTAMYKRIRKLKLKPEGYLRDGSALHSIEVLRIAFAEAKPAPREQERARVRLVLCSARECTEAYAFDGHHKCPECRQPRQYRAQTLAHAEAMANSLAERPTAPGSTTLPGGPAPSFSARTTARTTVAECRGEPVVTAGETA